MNVYEIYSPKTHLEFCVMYKGNVLAGVDFRLGVKFDIWKFVLENLYYESQMKEIIKSLGYKLTEIKLLAITFDDFWEKFDYKFDRKRAEDKWKKLPPEQKQNAFDYIEKYKNELRRSGVAQMYAKTYLQNQVWK
jgi:hypothetical protein